MRRYLSVIRSTSFLLTAALMLPQAATLFAHDVITTKLTWTREVSRIIMKRCSGCHHEGGPTPMNLMKYEEARPWAVAIREEVLNRRMPPWPAVKGYGEFKNDLSLSAQEIAILADWVEGGAPEGEPEYLPSHMHIENLPKTIIPKGFTVPITGGMSTPQLTALAIRVMSAPEDKQIQIRAVLPDGQVEPLLWLLPGMAKKRKTLVYKQPLKLPAGTRIETSPPKIGFVLTTSTPSPVR